MIFGIPAHEFAYLAVSLALAGVATGLLAGVFGVGGGAVIVPILFETFRLLGVPEDVRMPLSVGTSLAVIVPTSISSFRAHRKRGAVDMSVLRRWAVPVVLGVLAGSAVARYAPASVFQAVFVVVASLSAAKLLLGGERFRLADDLPKSGGAMTAYGGGIGVLSSLMGIGGGQISNLIMTFHARPIHQAVATSSGLGVLISIPGAIGYMLAGWPRMAEFPAVVANTSIGFVSLLGLALIAPVSMLAAPFGVRIAHALSKRRLEVAFGIFLVIVSARFAVALLT